MEKAGFAQINYASPPREGSILQLPIEQIYAEKGAKTPLKRNESIRLARNIQKYGISTPIIVTPVEAFPGFYRYCVKKGTEIWHAACIAGAKTLPCVIENATPKDPEVTQILAQIRCGALNLFEQAAAIRHLIQAHGLSRAEIAKETGFSPSAIANKLRLCRLSPAEQQEILCAGLTERHARAILRLSEPAKRLLALQVIRAEKMPVAAAESLVEAMLADTEELKAAEGAEIPSKMERETALQASKRGNFVPTGTPPQDGGGAKAGTACNACEEVPKATSVRKIPAVKPVTGSICPKKFALHTLQPLYNSIERTLSIFRKTGRGAEMQTQEGEDAVLITIRIPTVD